MTKINKTQKQYASSIDMACREIEDLKKVVDLFKKEKFFNHILYKSKEKRILNSICKKHEVKIDVVTKILDKK